MTFTQGLNLSQGALIDFNLSAAHEVIVVNGGTLTGPGIAAGATFEFSVTGEMPLGPLLLIDHTGAALANFTSFDFTGIGPIEYSYAFSDTGNYFEVNITAIPEPSSYAAFAGLGALALVLLKRRRRQAD